MKVGAEYCAIVYAYTCDDPIFYKKLKHAGRAEVLHRSGYRDYRTVAVVALNRDYLHK